jgi:hypothetical protein
VTNSVLPTADLHREGVASVRETDRRAFVRYNSRSASFPVRIGATECEIQLKDVSRGGASGLIGEPVSVGDYMVVELDRNHRVEAQVRWVRRLLVGVTFTNRLSDALAKELNARIQMYAEQVASSSNSQLSGSLYRIRMEDTMTKLSTENRDKLDKGSFAFPKQRKEPLENATHVRNAISRFNQVEDVSETERDAAWKRIKTAAKKHGVEVNEKSWREIGKN